MSTPYDKIVDAAIEKPAVKSDKTGGYDRIVDGVMELPDAPDARSRVPKTELERIRGVNPAFADTVQGFLDFAKERGVPDVYIKSGYRTAEEQNWLHRNGYPTKGNDGYVKISPHQKARAIDFSTKSPSNRSTMQTLLAAYARKRKLHIPADEPWHLTGPPNKEVHLSREPAVDPPLTKRQQAQAAMRGESPPQAFEPGPPQQRNWRELVADVRDRSAAAEARKPQPRAVEAPFVEPVVGEAQPRDLEFGGMTPVEREAYGHAQRKYSQIDTVGEMAVARMAAEAEQRKLQQQAATRRRQAQQAMGQGRGQVAGRPLTVGDAAWHFGSDADEAQSLGPSAQQILAHAVADDNQKRLSGQQIGQPSNEYRNEMRKRAGLNPLASGSSNVGELRRIEAHEQPGAMTMAEFRRSEERDALIAREVRPKVVKDFFKMGAGVRPDLPLEEMERQIAADPGIAEHINLETQRRVDQLKNRETGAYQVERGIAPPKGLADKIREIGEKPEQLIPFISSVPEIDNLLKAGAAADKLERGESLTTEEELRLRELLAANKQDASFLYKVADVVSALPSFVGEFVATGGVYTGARKGALKTLEHVVTKAGIEQLEKRLIGRVALKGATGLVGAAAQTLPAGATRIPAGVLYRKQVDGDDFGEALLKTVGDQFIEVASERSGGILSMIPVPKRLAAIRDAITARWLSKSPTRTIPQLQKLVEKTGWHGVLGEMFEERFGDVARYGVGLQDHALPSLEQLAIEGLAFSVPGGVNAGIGAVANARDSRRRRQIEGLLDEVVEPPSDQPVTPPTPATPRVEEKLGTINAQVDAFFQGRGNRKAVIFPASTTFAEKAKAATELPPGIDLAVGPNGDVVLFKPDITPREQVEQLLNTGRSNELTGLPNPEGPDATVVGVARVAEGPNKGEERFAGYIVPGNEGKFRKEAIAQFPDEVLSFEFGGRQTEEKVLTERQSAPSESLQGQELPGNLSKEAQTITKVITTSPAPAREEQQPPAAGTAKPSASETGVAEAATSTTSTPETGTQRRSAKPASPAVEKDRRKTERRAIERPDAYEIFTPERRAEVARMIAEAEPEDIDNMKRVLAGARERIESDVVTTPVREYKKKEPVQAAISDKPFTWKTKDGQTMQAAAGDWRVTHPNGRIGSVKPEVFKATYQPVEGKSGWYKKTAATKAQQLDRPFEVKTLEGKSRGEVGDYLVTGEKGEQYIVSKQEFEDLYSSVSGEKQEEPLVTHEPPKQRDYVDFAPDSGTLGIRRASMPQIKSGHRGALANRLKARGISYTEEEVLPGTLKPSQAEYSETKVARAREWRESGKSQRKLLISSDGYVLDGHHQWKDSLDAEPGVPIPIIRLSVPAQEALLELSQFPSSEVQGSHGENEPDTKTPEQSPTLPASTTSLEMVTIPFEGVASDVQSGTVSPRAARGDEARATQKANVKEKEEEEVSTPAAQVEEALGPEPKVDDHDRWRFIREVNSIDWEAREERLNDDRLIYKSSQKSATVCTGAACEVGHIFGTNRTKLFGFGVSDNPSSSIALEWDGHDFALVDDRFIVDPWLRETANISERIWFDTQDPADEQQITQLYGERSKWIRGTILEESLPKVGEIDSGFRYMSGPLSERLYKRMFERLQAGQSPADFPIGQEPLFEQQAKMAYDAGQIKNWQDLRIRIIDSPETLRTLDEITASGRSISMLDTDASLYASTEVSGISYQLYKAETSVGTLGIVRTFDTNAGRTLELLKYPSFKEAQTEYREVIKEVESAGTVRSDKRVDKKGTPRVRREGSEETLGEDIRREGEGRQQVESREGAPERPAKPEVAETHGATELTADDIGALFDDAVSSVAAQEEGGGDAAEAQVTEWASRLRRIVAGLRGEAPTGERRAELEWLLAEGQRYRDRAGAKDDALNEALDSLAKALGPITQGLTKAATQPKTGQRSTAAPVAEQVAPEDSTFDRALTAYKRIAPAIAQPVLEKNAKRMADIIDNKKAGDDLLRTNNKMSRKVFTELTGIDLGKTERDAVEAVEKWASAQEEPEMEPAVPVAAPLRRVTKEEAEARWERAKRAQAERIQDPAAVSAKPSLAAATQALSDIFAEEEDQPGGTAQFARMEPEFDEAKYARAEPQFIMALQSFHDQGLSLKESVPALVRYLNTEAGYKAATIARMKPYVVHFIQNVQAGTVDIAAKEVAVSGVEQTSNIVKLAGVVRDHLASGKSLNNPQLRDLAERAFGGTIAQGTYTSKDAYDALELGVNQFLLTRAGGMLAGDAQTALSEIRSLMSNLPRQTDRTADTDQLQQFSTPPTLAFVAAKALDIQLSDVMVEPSAGTGNLALWGKAAGATVHTNEVSPRRRETLQALGFTPTSVDAELLNDLLPADVKPSIILMNPPFSATGGRTASNDTKYGARHIEQALLRLEPGGRAVIITGEGMAIGKHKFTDWWRRIMSRYNVRANLGIPGDEYGKYGTTFGTQLLVIDKTGPTPGSSSAEQLKNVRFGDVKSLEEALHELQPIIADRTQPTASRTLEQDRGDIRRGRRGAAPAPDRGGELSGPGRSESTVGEVGSGESTGSAGSVQTRKPGDRPAKPRQPQSVRGGGGRAEGVRLADGVTATSEPEYVPADLGLTYERRTETREAEESGTFVKYRPAKLGGAMTHPADIVESASMSAVDPPDISYVPQLPAETVKEGKLSDLQLESVSYAGQRFEQRLPNGARAGYFLGDGTGVGKGRQISGTILDQWNAGNRRVVWLSVSKDLIEDASRDLKDIGAGHIPLAAINDFAPSDDIGLPKGVIFSTYNSLISAAKTGNKQKRREQLEKWLGTDGLIIFDEAHKAKNALGQGQSEPTQTGQAVIDIQTNLPNARVVYASATGATDVRNMAYMVRLGLWGPGTSFPGGFIEFMGEIDRGGVGAMEMVSRDMKALGMYASRSISFNGVDYQETVHELTPEQRHIYDTAANAMQVVLQNIGEALGITNASKRAQMMALQRFWADHQRLFRQLISSFKVPTVIRQTERALAEGKSVVIGLIGTGESRTKEQVTKALSVGTDLEDLDFSPREFVANLIDKAFPVNVYQEVTDKATGKTTRELARDEDGNPVISREAQALKDRMLDQISDLHLPENPLDQVVNHFGERQVAEMTGRKRRLIRGADGKMAYKKRAPDGVAMTRVNVHENRQFQSGKKRIAIISDAAATGISLHASNREENKQRRVHMTLELGWSADKQMQTFGRTHRSDQATPPEYDLISTDIGGEKRFSSTIARRLASLGALTKGQRDATGGGDLAKYNFETEEGKAALTRFYSNIMSGGKIEGIENPQQALRDMGILKVRGDHGETISDDDMVDVPRFLNRILALNLDRQNVLFNEFVRIFEQTVDYAKESGTFDEGVADVKGESIRMKTDPQVVFTDQVTGAETTHYSLEVDVKTNPVSWDDAKRFASREKSGFYKQRRSGNIIVADEAASHTDPATGFVFKTYAITTPLQERDHFIRDAELAQKYDEIKPSEAKEWWLTTVNNAPRIKTTQTHVIGGAILPLWQRLKTEEGARLKVVRVVTDDGQRVVGINVPTKQIASVLRSLGMGRELKTPEEIFTAVLDQDDTIKLSSGLSLAHSKLHGEDVIEVRGAEYQHFNALRQMDLINERIDWKQKFFVPSNLERGIPALKMLLGSYPVVDMRSESKSTDTDVDPQFSQAPRGWETAASGPPEDVDFSIEGNHITLNQTARQLMSDAYRFTPVKYRMPPNGIGGVYEKNPEALAQALEHLAAQEPARADGAQRLASAVREVSREHGPVSLAFGDVQRRHEGLHRTSHEASGESALDQRHTPEGFKRLAAHSAWPTIHETLLRRNYSDNIPTLVEEAFAYLAVGDNLGLTDEQADSFMEEWLRSFKEKNGSPSIAKFKELSDAAERARERVYAAESTTIGGRPGSSVQSVSDRGTKGAPSTHEEGARGEPWQKPRATSGLNENQHREVVAQAINTGKDVPPEVLAEYPGLAESIRFEHVQMSDRSNDPDIDDLFHERGIGAVGGVYVRPKDGQALEAELFDPGIIKSRLRLPATHTVQIAPSFPETKITEGGMLRNLDTLLNTTPTPPVGSDRTDVRIIVTITDRNGKRDIAAEDALFQSLRPRFDEPPVELGDIETPRLRERSDAEKFASLQSGARDLEEALRTRAKEESEEPTDIQDFSDDGPAFAEHEDPWTRLLKLAEEIQRPEGMEARRLPKTMEAAGLETGDNLFFPPTTVATGIEMGKQMVADKGVDGAMEFVRTGDGIGWASTGYEVLAQLRADEARIRPTDAQAADSIAEKRLRFLDEFVERSTELGRAIVGIKAIEVFAPDRAAYHLNKLSRKHRKRGLTQEEESNVTALALELARVNDQLKATEEQIEYRKQVARELEDELAAAESRARRRERYQPGERGEGEDARRPLMRYEVTLEEQGKEAKDALLVKIGNLDFGNMKVSAGKFPKQAGSVSLGDSSISELPGDAELLAQYAAGQLPTFDTVAELNTHLLETFGQDIEPYLPAVRQRAWQIRRIARAAELGNPEVEPQRRRTILAEIQAEIVAGQRAIKEMEKAHSRAEKERETKELQEYEKAQQAVKDAQRAVLKAKNSETRKAAKDQLAQAKAEQQEKGRTKPISPKSARRARLDEVTEARQRLSDTRKEYQEASKAEVKGWRQQIKEQREAARRAEWWDTPIHEAATVARERLQTATDPNDPQVMEDLAAVAAEKFLPDTPGGPVRKKAIDPSKLYVDLLDEFPNLVNKKNQKEVYKRGYQRILDMEAAAREAATRKSARNESQKMWEKLGVDTEAQALLIQRATRRRQQQELRHKMTQEFERVSRGRLSNFFFELNAFPRSAKSSIDAPELRQGLMSYLTHPLAIAPTIKAALEGYAAIHPADYQALVEQLQQMPRYEQALHAGLDLPEIVGEGDPRVHAEEYFQSGWGQKVPHIRVSEQAFVLSMNHKRMVLWNLLAPAGEAHGYTWENNPEFFKQVAQFINDVTGRGNVPDSLARFMSTWLNWFFFAPRYNVSKIQLMNDLFNPLKYISAEWAPQNPALRAVARGVHELQRLPGSSAYDPVMRKIAFEHVIRWMGAMLALLTAAYTLGRMLGMDVEFDPEDSDSFPKLRWGNHVYDFSGGNVGTVRFLYRFLKGMAKMTAGYHVSGYENPYNIAMGERGFVRQKLSPWVGGYVDFLSEKDVNGKPATVKSPAGWYKQGLVKTIDEDILVNMVTPIIVSDLIESGTDSGWMGVAKSTPAFLGMGVQTYPKKEKPSDTQKLMYEKLAMQREQTPEEKERRDLKRKLEEQIRQGKPVVAEIDKAVREGKLLPTDRVEIARSATLKPEQLVFKELNVVDAMDVFEDSSTTDAQRAEFKDILKSKGPNIWNLPTPEQDAAAARFKKITGEDPPKRRRRTFSPNQWKRLQKRESALPPPTQ